MNRIIKILGIAKSSIYYQSRPYPKRKKIAKKHLSDAVKNHIRSISTTKSTYGIPRVRAILKRDYGVVLSKYMVHRFMKEEGLLLKRFRTRGNSRTHTGKIAVDKSNTRWASDITAIKCWNGQKLRLAFVIDCCDRSIISWKAGLHIQGCDIELMVQDAIFERFGESLPPKGQLLRTDLWYIVFMELPLPI